MIFFSLVGPSGSEKLHPVFDWLKIYTFQTKFDKSLYFDQDYQPLYGQMQRNILQFIQEIDFEMIENIPNNETKYWLIIDDFCEDT